MFIIRLGYRNVETLPITIAQIKSLLNSYRCAFRD